MKKGSKTTKLVGVEVELLKDSPCDVAVDTHETLETVAEELEVKQVGVEVDLLKDSPINVVTDT